MSDLGINPYGSMMESNASILSCKCGECVKCIKNNWKNFFQNLQNPSKLNIKIKEDLASTTTIPSNQYRNNLSFDELSNSSQSYDADSRKYLNKSKSDKSSTNTHRSSYQTDHSMNNSVDSGTSSSSSPNPIPTEPCFPKDPDECYNEAVRMKRQADDLYNIYKEIQSSIHKYIRSIIRFLYASNKKIQENLNEVRSLFDTANLCNYIIGIANKHKYDHEESLLFLLKAYSYYLIYKSSENSIESLSKHAFVSKELDKNTKKYIDTTYYLIRAIAYLKLISKHYPQSPLHLRFLNVDVVEILNFVEIQLQDLKK